MARRNAAPLCQDDDPQSGPVTNSLWFASVTLQPNQLDQRITPLAIRESRPAFPSQYATLKCVDALAQARGREQTESAARGDHISPKHALAARLDPHGRYEDEPSPVAESLRTSSRRRSHQA